MTILDLFDPCFILWRPLVQRWRAANLDDWLDNNPNVADAIRWQVRPANWADAYQPPSPYDKVPYPSWSRTEKNALHRACADAFGWLACDARPIAMNPRSPVSGLLIDEVTYQQWFSADLDVNITDLNSPALANVGRRAAEFM